MVVGPDIWSASLPLLMLLLCLHNSHWKMGHACERYSRRSVDQVLDLIKFLADQNNFLLIICLKVCCEVVLVSLRLSIGLVTMNAVFEPQPLFSWCRSEPVVKKFIMAAHSNGQAIIFRSCGFYLLSFFFSSPILSGRRLDVCHTSTHDVALVQT